MPFPINLVRWLIILAGHRRPGTVADRGQQHLHLWAGQDGKRQNGYIQFHLQDALGSVRKMADCYGKTWLVKNFDPWEQRFPQAAPFTPILRGPENSGSVRMAHFTKGEQLEQVRGKTWRDLEADEITTEKEEAYQTTSIDVSPQHYVY